MAVLDGEADELVAALRPAVALALESAVATVGRVSGRVGRCLDLLDLLYLLDLLDFDLLDLAALLPRRCTADFADAASTVLAASASSDSNSLAATAL